MKSVRGEAVSLSLALALPVAAFCLLPYSLPKGTNAMAASHDGFAAFIALTQEEEAQATSRAKPSALTAEAANASARALNLVLGELPADAPSPLLATPPPSPPPPLPDLAAELVPFLPSQAAPSPRTIPMDAEKPAPPGFSRDDLLKID